MTRPLLRLALPLLAAPFAACQCPGEDVAAIAPQIYMDVCAEPQREVQGVFIGGFRECAHDFGTRDISVKVTKEIKVTNPSRVELVLDNVEIVGDPAFKLELAPEVIAPGLSGVIVVSLRPRVEAPIAASLFVLSDANNTEQLPDCDGFCSLIEVPLTANGVDNGVPEIEVTPLVCDYERVAAGGVALCPVSVRNIGQRGLVLDEVLFVPPPETATLFDVPPDSVRDGGDDGACDPSLGDECAFAFTGRPPDADEEIAPDGEAVLTVRFTPDTLGNYRGLFKILSNDSDEAEIDIPLQGIAVTPPQCVARVKSVNGIDVEAGSTPVIEPLDNVVLTLEDSTPSTPDGSIAGYEWVIPPDGRPTGSTVQLTSPTAETTGFTFDDEIGVDLAGQYTVRAVVIDDLGTQSVNECEVSFESVPQGGLLVQLSWDALGADLDLHVSRAGSAGKACFANTSGDSPSGLASETGAACELPSKDCNFSTCRATAGSPPDWDAVGGRTPGDPVLDIDDIDGLGPENINVDEPVEGSYVIGINEFLGTSSVGTFATVRVFVFGRIAAESFLEFSPGDWKEISIVHWPADTSTDEVCIEDLTDGNATDECP